MRQRCAMLLALTISLGSLGCSSSNQGWADCDETLHASDEFLGPATVSGKLTLTSTLETVTASQFELTTEPQASYPMTGCAVSSLHDVSPQTVQAPDSLLPISLHVRCAAYGNKTSAIIDIVLRTTSADAGNWTVGGLEGTPIVGDSACFDDQPKSMTSSSLMTGTVLPLAAPGQGVQGSSATSSDFTWTIESSLSALATEPDTPTVTCLNPPASITLDLTVTVDAASFDVTLAPLTCAL